METTATSIYTRALTEAQTELVGIRQEYDRLAKRKAQLEALIANLTPLLPASANVLGFPEDAADDYQIGEKPLQPIWKSILQSINGKHNSFSVKDALEGLERIGRGVDSPNKFQIVRAVLIRKTENFEKIGPGEFRVKKGLAPKTEGAV